MHCLAKSTMAVQWHNYEVTEQDSLIIDLFQAKVDQGFCILFLSVSPFLEWSFWYIEYLTTGTQKFVCKYSFEPNSCACSYSPNQCQFRKGDDL
jgi:hypothetical protein